MKPSIEKIVKTVQQLEQDFMMMDRDNPESVEMMKDRAHILMPMLKIAKEDSSNFEYKKLYQKLEEKVIRIISQLQLQK
ncbi:hypothetical protein [uncultured Croceitalea sp.]|uniref:hypothetical protein n=1 Tax=uncultured Croceitalea sp. TaxID=1798908 RepID=UPI00374F8188